MSGPGENAQRYILRPADLVLLVAVLVARVAFSANRRIFQIVPDEAATAAMARRLAGGTRWDMFINSVWRPGPATVYAPVFVLTDDPVWRFRAMVLMAATIGSLAALVLVRIVGGLLPEESGAAVRVASGATAVMPAALVSSAHIWAEPFVTLAFVLVVFFLWHSMVVERSRFSCCAVAAGGLGAVSHGRMLPLLVVAGSCGVAIEWMRGRRLQAAAVTAATMSVYVLIDRYVAWFVDELWLDPGPGNSVSAVLERLTKPLDVLSSLLGQAWYSVVSTLGLSAVGACVVVRRTRVAAPARSLATVLLVVATPLVAVSAVFMADRPKVEQLAYGRYNDAVIWPFVAVGGLWASRAIADRTCRRAGAVSLAASVLFVVLATYALELIHGDRWSQRPGRVEMVAGLIPFGASQAEMPIGTIALFGSIGIAALGTIAYLGRSVLTTGVVLALVWCGWWTHRGLSPGLNRLTYAEVVIETNEVLPDDEPVGYLFVTPDRSPSTPYATQLYWAHGYQWYLDDHRFTLGFDASDLPTTYVFAPDNAGELVALDAELVWRDPFTFLALWKRPTS